MTLALVEAQGEGKCSNLVQPILSGPLRSLDLHTWHLYALDLLEDLLVQHAHSYCHFQPEKKLGAASVRCACWLA